MIYIISPLSFVTPGSLVSIMDPPKINTGSSLLEIEGGLDMKVLITFQNITQKVSHQVLFAVLNQPIIPIYSPQRWLPKCVRCFQNTFRYFYKCVFPPRRLLTNGMILGEIFQTSHMYVFFIKMATFTQKVNKTYLWLYLNKKSNKKNFLQRNFLPESSL